MLQQILRDMWVDPEILAELDDTQKQTLFCKMREEQVRRWRIWDQKLSNENSEKRVGQRKRSTTKKSVQFLQCENGEPWVWVMGEHKSDRSIEDILLEEAKKKAQQQAQIEAEQLRKSVERELTHLIDDYKPLDTFNEEINISPKQDIEESMEIYCTVDELRQRIQDLEPELKLHDSEEGNNNNSCLSLGKINVYNNNERNLNMELAKNTLNFNFIEGKRDVLHELSVGEGACERDSVVGRRVAAWERRVACERAGQILRGLRERRAAQAQEAEKAEVHQNTLWREQERKAKEAEHQIREIARRAREEHRRSTVPDDTDSEPTESCYTDADTSLANGIGKPPNRQAVVDWFREKELPRGAGLDENRKPADWFHGMIGRLEAERVLQGCQAGAFLLRVSERIWGYVVSYRAEHRCKHYLVDASTAHYRFLGDNQKTHNSLGDLVKFHCENAITESGQEKLLSPCLVQDTHSVQQLCS